jgi:Cof subfamily protein (haloacid dehalogenase superfamily)
MGSSSHTDAQGAPVRPRIVFSDMDDTFLAPDKSLLPRNMAMLDRLAEEGIEFVPCTGRAWHAIPPEVCRHPATHFGVPSDGSVVIDATSEKVLLDQSLGARRALALLSRVDGLLDRMTFEVFADGRVLTNRASWELIGQLGLPAAQTAYMQASRTLVDKPLEQVIRDARTVERLGMCWGVVEGSREVADAARAAVEQDSTLRHTGSYGSAIEVVDARASKGSALAWLCDRLGIAREQSVAFGDSPNDLEMVRAAGDGVAVGNACEALLAEADHVTATNAESGFATYLEALLG